MNVNEIKAIIAEKIAGQGNQVDIGNGLVEVLNALAEGLEATDDVVANKGFDVFGDKTKSEAATEMGMTEADFDKLLHDYHVNKVINTVENNTYFVTKGGASICLFSGSSGGTVSVVWVLRSVGDMYSLSEP